MKREETLADKDKKFDVATTVTAAAVGIATTASMFWYMIRNSFSQSLSMTGAYKEARKKRDTARGKLLKDTPDFLEKYARIDEVFKEDIDGVHETLKLKGIPSIGRRLKLTDSARKVEAIERAAGFGFMATTLVVGLGVLLKLSQRPDLKEPLARKEPGGVQSIG